MPEDSFRITGIELFQFGDPRVMPRGESLSTAEGCHYGLLKVTSCGQTGWGECVLCENVSSFDLVRWSAFLFELKKPTISQALVAVESHREQWGERKTELVRNALTDLAAHLYGPQRPDSTGEPSVAPKLLMDKCEAYFKVL